MRIKRTIKRIGRCFIALKQENEGVISQSVLLVDNGYSWLGYLHSAIEKIKKYFPNADISVLTFTERKAHLQKDFPALKFILPSERIGPKRYQVALQMLKIRKQRYDFITLFSLDIIPTVVSLLFMNSKVVLYNQWEQWWSLRLRNINEVFKIIYVKKKSKFNLKNFLKRIGLFFILLQREDEEAFKYSILIVDSGYALYEQIDNAMQQIKEAMPGAKISLLALEQREELKNNFPDIDIIKPGKCIIKKFRIARHMFKLRKNRYDYIILLSLDITPIIVSMLFMKGKVLLHNRWHQWWTFKPRSMKGYLMVIPQLILNSVIFVYLLISVSWIFLKRSFNIFRFSLLKRKV